LNLVVIKLIDTMSHRQLRRLRGCMRSITWKTDT